MKQNKKKFVQKNPWAEQVGYQYTVRNLGEIYSHIDKITDTMRTW